MVATSNTKYVIPLWINERNKARSDVLNRGVTTLNFFPTERPILHSAYTKARSHFHSLRVWAGLLEITHSKDKDDNLHMGMHH